MRPPATGTIQRAYRRRVKEYDGGVRVKKKGRVQVDVRLGKAGDERRRVEGGKHVCRRGPKRYNNMVGTDVDTCTYGMSRLLESPPTKKITYTMTSTNMGIGSQPLSPVPGAVTLRHLHRQTSPSMMELVLIHIRDDVNHVLWELRSISISSYQGYFRYRHHFSQAITRKVTII